MIVFLSKCALPFATGAYSFTQLHHCHKSFTAAAAAAVAAYKLIK